MSSSKLTRDDLVKCLLSIGLEPAGYLRFSDGVRSIDLSDATDEDIDVIGTMIRGLPAGLVEAQETELA
jgi:hypothetical protein